MPRLVAAARDVAPAILEALKLNAKNVKRLELDFNADDLVFCRIEFYPTLEQLENVTEALETQMKCYALAELDCSQQSHEQ
jgi:hypothetical protein